MVLLTKAMSIYFEVNPSEFFATGSKIKIDECTLLGSFTYARRRTTNLSKTLYNVYCTLINKPLFNVKRTLVLF